MDTNFVYQKTVFFRTGIREQLESLIQVGDDLVMRLEIGFVGGYDSRFIKLDSNYNIIWDRYYTNIKKYGNYSKITNDINGNIIFAEYKDTVGGVDGYLVKLDKNTGLPILREAMHNNYTENVPYILFTTLDHRIIVTNNRTLDIYDEHFNLIKHIRGVYSKQIILSGYEVEDGFILMGVLVNIPRTALLDYRAYICKTDKNGNKIWERYLPQKPTVFPDIGDALNKGCKGFGEGYAFCGFSWDSAIRN